MKSEIKYINVRGELDEKALPITDKVGIPPPRERTFQETAEIYTKHSFLKRAESTTATRNTQPTHPKKQVVGKLIMLQVLQVMQVLQLI